VIALSEDDKVECNGIIGEVDKQNKEIETDLEVFSKYSEALNNEAGDLIKP
jgi:hypothetical protein